MLALDSRFPAREIPAASYFGKLSPGTFGTFQIAAKLRLKDGIYQTRQQKNTEKTVENTTRSEVFTEFKYLFASS